MGEPPTYSHPDSVSQLAEGDPQIQILPSDDALNFQQGYLGAEDERAAIEGEIQVKTSDPAQWSKLTVSLRSVESSFDHEIELGFSEICLFSGTATWSSSFPFSVPLMPDTPQSIQTPHSALYHTLTATLISVDPLKAPVRRSVQVYTRRYSAHAYTLPLAPQTISHNDPTPMEVQIPRTSFKVDEPIPVYVTIPPPRIELVMEEGVRLRNIRVQLVRVVEVSTNADMEHRDHGEGTEVDSATNVDESSSGPVSDDTERLHSVTTTSEHSSQFLLGSSYRSVVSKSGGSCRFHATKPVRLRFLLTQAADGSTQNDADSPPITQTTLLHSVSFHVNVMISFVNIESHHERIATVKIPVEILPPPAALPQVDPSLDAAYSKKHDRPPSRTIRTDDAESSAPIYSVGQAGPSAQPLGAPPPFDDRDAPPPFFAPRDASNPPGLPSFLESEQGVAVAASESDIQQVHFPPLIAGEGTEFGFSSSQQFDGHTDEMQPPPSLEMSAQDPDITSLVRETENFGLAVEGQGANGREDLPPPPPAMDDPSDPPPVIDFSYSSDRPASDEGGTSTQSVNDNPSEDSVRPRESEGPHPQQQGTNAPPPYLGEHAGRQHTRNSPSGPPPYVD